jgi:hypothetical protein
MGASVGAGDAVHFPYAVVEIKLQAEPPGWLEGLLQSGAARAVAAAASRPQSSNGQLQHSAPPLVACLSSAAAGPAPGLDWPPHRVLISPPPAPPPLPPGMLLPAPKFSKFLHGAALLFQPACANVPYWFLPGGRNRPARKHAMPCPAGIQ